MAKEGMKTLRFFKVLLPGFSNKLMLPCDFVELNNKEETSKTATLLSPNGKTWKVELIRVAQNHVCIGGEKWREFTVANKLEVGYMLVFHYKGNMLFSFRVFDLSAREVSYSSSIAENGRIVKEEIISGRNSVQALPQTRCMKRKKDDQNFSVYKRTRHGCRKQRFEVIIEACNLSRRRRCMQIPTEFMTSCDLLKKCEEAIIRDPKGQIWPIGLFHCTNYNASYISKGWLGFARANELKEGSRCIFELTPQANINKLIMSVEILNSKPSGACFEATIRSSNLSRSYMNIPTDLLKYTWLKHCDELMLRDSKSRLWPVKIIRSCRPSRRASMSMGWQVFARSNQLEVGDKCIFQLVSDGKENCVQVKIIKVHILKLDK